MITRVFTWLFLLIASLSFPACHSNPNTGGIDDPPSRLGSMPFPGIYTLYHKADPYKLGRHSYEGGLIHGARTETSRGTMYTCHGGFIDIAHLRKGADLTRHAAFYVAKSLRNRDAAMAIKGKEPSIYHLTYTYPPDWDSIPPDEKEKLITEASIRIGQRLSILQTTWHEALTWFGYESFILPEKTSAFSYDDMYSHVVGSYVGAAALRDTTLAYNPAIDYHLDKELESLGRVSVDQCTQAILAVKDQWWTGGLGRQRKRFLHNIFAEKSISPWLVPNLDFCSNDDKPVTYDLPPLDNVLGHDLTNLVHIQIEPRVSCWRTMQRLFDPQPQWCDPDQHFPTLFAQIKKEMQQEFGDQVDTPDLNIAEK